MSQENKFIFSGKVSIWGRGDRATLELLRKIKIKGRWLNLAAGDGRYNLNLLKKTDFVVASDINASALKKLWHNTPKKYKKKLNTKVFDIAKKFPFPKNTFDGIFCTGTLHLFPKRILKKIFLEINRVIKPNGRIIIDFATDIRRITLNKKLLRFRNEPRYSLAEAKKTLKNLLKNYKVKLYASEVADDLKGVNPPYKLTCKFLLVIADKI